MRKQTVMIDFDGVIHSYTTPWEAPEIIPDPPTLGAQEAVAKLRERFQVVVYSTRALQGGLYAMDAWLDKHGIEVDDITGTKRPGVVYVDDRGFRFNGDWDEVLKFADGDMLPWNKKGRS